MKKLGKILLGLLIIILLYSATFWTVVGTRYIIKNRPKNLISSEEITRVANSYNLNSQQTEALERVNEYFDKLKRHRKKPLIFFIEGGGRSPVYEENEEGKFGAMCVVVQNGSVTFLSTNCSTIPDYLTIPSGGLHNGKLVATILDGIYYCTTSTNKRGEKYPILNVYSKSKSEAEVLFSEEHYDDEIDEPHYFTGTDPIIINKRIENNNADSEDRSWTNSIGNLLVGEVDENGYSKEYDDFAKAVGFAIFENGVNTGKGTNISSRVVIDRKLVEEELVDIYSYSECVDTIVNRNFDIDFRDLNYSYLER